MVVTGFYAECVELGPPKFLWFHEPHYRFISSFVCMHIYSNSVAHEY